MQINIKLYAPPYIIFSGPINIYVTLDSLGWLLCLHFPNMLSALQGKLRPNWTEWWSLDREDVALEKDLVAYVSQGELEGQWLTGPKQGQSKL